jgi:hypothetical protein
VETRFITTYLESDDGSTKQNNNLALQVSPVLRGKGFGQLRKEIMTPIEPVRHHLNFVLSSRRIAFFGISMGVELEYPGVLLYSIFTPIHPLPLRSEQKCGAG